MNLFHIVGSFYFVFIRNPEKFQSRNRNRMYYTLASSKEFIRPYWGNLMNFVTIVCDGVDYTEKLKQYKANGILILNILSYAGGSRPWNAKAKVFHCNITTLLPNGENKYTSYSFISYDKQTQGYLNYRGKIIWMMD